MEMILAMEGGNERNILAAFEPESLNFEYEVDSNRNKVVLGRGTYGTASILNITFDESLRLVSVHWKLIKGNEK